MSYLFLTLGYPGSGKTYFSERFSKEMDIVHLNADRFRLQMFAQPTYTPEEHRQLFEAMDKKCKELLENGQSVIYDANHNRRWKRKVMQDIADAAGARYLLLYFKTPLEVALERNAGREIGKTEEEKTAYRTVDEAVIHRMNRNIETPGDNEPFVEVDGLADYSVQTEQVKQAIENRKPTK